MSENGSKKQIDYGTCDCCGKEPAIGVAAVPYVAMSIALGVNCLKAGVIPYNIAVANTACINGIENAAKDWKELVDLTCKYFKKTEEEFNNDVKKDIESMSQVLDRLEEQKKTTFIFIRENNGKEFFYPVEGIDDPSKVKDHVDLNPGTIRVEDCDGNIVWPVQ